MTVSDQITTADEVRRKLDDFGPERWVEALESGQYTHMQCSLGLVEDDTIRACCLGVLAHAAGVTRYVESVEWPELVIPRPWQPLHCPASSDIPEEASPAWLEAEGDVGISHQERLIAINDADGTRDYARQIEYIREHVIPTWKGQNR